MNSARVTATRSSMRRRVARASSASTSPTSTHEVWARDQKDAALAAWLALGAQRAS